MWTQFSRIYYHFHKSWQTFQKNDELVAITEHFIMSTLNQTVLNAVLIYILDNNDQFKQSEDTGNISTHNIQLLMPVSRQHQNAFC